VGPLLYQYLPRFIHRFPYPELSFRWQEKEDALLVLVTILKFITMEVPLEKSNCIHRKQIGGPLNGKYIMETINERGGEL